MRGLTQLSLLTLLSSLLSACVIDQNLSQPDVYLCNSDDDCISGFFCEESLEEDDQEVTGFCVPIEDDGDDEATDISDASDAADPTDATDSSDATDAPDTTDPSDASETSDGTDPSEATDATDASDSSDVSNPDDCGDPIILETPLPEDDTQQDVTLRLDCWNPTTGAPTGAAYTDLFNNYEWQEFATFAMEPVDDEYFWAGYKLVGTMADGTQRIIFFSDPQNERGLLELLVFGESFQQFYFDTGIRSWGGPTCDEPLSNNFLNLQGQECEYNLDELVNFNGGFENYCGESEDRIWQWTANPTDGVANAMYARRGDGYISYGSAPMPSAADTFSPLEGDGALKLFADGDSTSGTSGLTLTRTTPSLAGRPVLVDAFVYISRFEPLENGASGELTFTSFDANNNEEIELVSTSIHNDLSQDTWHSIRLCTYVPEGTGTTEIGLNITHTNSARGTIYVDNVRMRQVALCVFDEELNETDFGDFPQTFYEEGSYQDSVFRDGICSELGGSASCSTPEGLKDCSSDSDRVGPYNSAPICMGTGNGGAGEFTCSFECLPGFQASTTPIDNSCVPEGSPAGMATIPNGTYTRGCDTAINGSCTAEAQPQFSMQVSSFHIDIAEVTAGQYRECAQAGICEEPALGGPEFELSSYYSFRDDAAMNFVTYSQAKTYCAFRGKRLPTEAEWEVAAGAQVQNSMTTRTDFPWGDAPPPDCDHAIKGSCSYSYPQSIGTLARGHSFFGLANMGGNVREWVHDYYQSNLYSNSAERIRFGGPQENVEQQNTVRGGSFDISSGVPFHTWHRSGLPGGLREVDLGFRCVQPATLRNAGMACISEVDCLTGSCEGEDGAKVCL